MTPNTTDSEWHTPNEKLDIPKWINEDYFRPILEHEFPDLVGIRKFMPIAATAPGENYTSVMIRVHIEMELNDGSTKQHSYILKTMLGDAASRELVNVMELFPKEQKMYQVLIPAFEKLYNLAGLKLRLAPQCHRVETTAECITLIMEDLKPRNFINVDRLQGFDMEHMRAVLRKLGELHAASAVYHEMNGPYDEYFDNGVICAKNRDFFETLGNSRRKQNLEAIKKHWDLEDPDYFASKMVEPSVLCDETLRLSKTDPLEFNVLNHGDCWSNNIMFSYKENGEIEETLLVDLQISKWGSPAQDLWYLITASAALDIKVKEFDHFIKIYHDRLVECLKMLKYEKHIPSLKELHGLMLKYSCWGVFTSVGVMIATLLPTDEDASIENMMKFGPEGDEFRMKSFLNPYYADAMAILLPFFDSKGALDLD